MHLEDNLIAKSKTKKLKEIKQNRKTKKAQKDGKKKNLVSNQSRMTKIFDPATMHPAAL